MTTTEKRVTGWGGSAGYWAAIILATQIPSLFRTVFAAGKISDHVCEMASQGHKIQVIADGMEGDRRFRYTKRWEPLAKAVVMHNLKSCPAIVSAIK